MSKPTTSKSKKFEEAAVVTTTFRRFEHQHKIILDTPWGPATLTPHKGRWHLYTLVRGTIVAQQFTKLKLAMTAAMHIKGVTSSKLIHQIENPGLCPLF